MWTKTLEHHLLVNCGIRVDLKAATFSLFGQSSTNISAHLEGESLLQGETRERPGLCWALLVPAAFCPGENSSSVGECISQVGFPWPDVSLFGQSSSSISVRLAVPQEQWTYQREMSLFAGSWSSPLKSQHFNQQFVKTGGNYGVKTTLKLRQSIDSQNNLQIVCLVSPHLNSSTWTRICSYDHLLDTYIQYIVFQAI